LRRRAAFASSICGSAKRLSRISGAALAVGDSIPGTY
jgi:hypothetical protein